MADVLLIDDEAHYLKSLAEGLSLYSKKLNIITADNGKKAIEILSATSVDVVVTDLNMPGMNGYEFLHQLQQTHPHLPVIIMSACSRASVDAHLKNLRFVQYIEKPLNLDEIARAILSVV